MFSFYNYSAQDQPWRFIVETGCLKLCLLLAILSSRFLVHFKLRFPFQRIIPTIPSTSSEESLKPTINDNSDIKEARSCVQRQWRNHHHRALPLTFSLSSLFLFYPSSLHIAAFLLPISCSCDRRWIAARRESSKQPGRPRKHPHKVHFIYRKSMARRISPARCYTMQLN